MELQSYSSATMAHNLPLKNSRILPLLTTSNTIKTSSPQYPQSNGQVERMVQTIKNLLKKSSDPYMALLSYRATPFLWCNLSPAELLMGRKVRTTLPQIKEHLVPQWQYPTQFRQRNKKFKQRQKMYYDRSHHTTQLPSLPNHTQVWVKQRIKWMKQQ